MADLNNLKGERKKFDLGGIRAGTSIGEPGGGKNTTAGRLPKSSGNRLAAPERRETQSPELGKNPDVYVVETLGETKDGEQLAATFEVSFPKGTKVLGVQAFHAKDYDRT